MSNNLKDHHDENYSNIITIINSSVSRMLSVKCTYNIITFIVMIKTIVRHNHNIIINFYDTENL